MTDITTETPNWIVQTGSWLRKHLVVSTATIAILFTLANQYESLGAPIVATRGYVNSQVDSTINGYFSKSGIDKTEYPNVKNYIDARDREIQREFAEKIVTIEKQNTKIITQVDLMLGLLQSRMTKP